MRLQYSSLNCSGCFLSASTRLLPASTSALIPRISSCMPAFSCPRPTISKACTRGTPEDIMVASCRLNTVMSLGVILDLPALLKRDFGFFFTLRGFTPWRRRFALTRASLCPLISPFTRLPDLSVPSQPNISALAACAICRLLYGYAVYFRQGGYPVHNFFQTGTANIPDAF